MTLPRSFFKDAEWKSLSSDTQDKLTTWFMSHNEDMVHFAEIADSLSIFLHSCLHPDGRLLTDNQIQWLRENAKERLNILSDSAEING